MPVILPEIYQRYLRILGVEGRPEGVNGLTEIVRRHLFGVPWENISKLVLLGREGRGRFFTLPEFLDHVEQQDIGGTCYANNPFLASLLRALGFEAEILGADMSRAGVPRPNVHTSLRVKIGATAYHVDVGYGGPFRDPIPLDRLPFEMLEGYRYYMEPVAGADGYDMAVFSGQERVHGYTVHEPPRQPEFFADALAKSFQPEAAFLNCIRVCRFFEDYSVELLDRKLCVHRGAATTITELTTAAEWADAIRDSLRMPRCPWREALEVLEGNTKRSFFEAQTAGADS